MCYTLTNKSYIIPTLGVDATKEIGRGVREKTVKEALILPGRWHAGKSAEV